MKKLYFLAFFMLILINPTPAVGMDALRRAVLNLGHRWFGTAPARLLAAAHVPDAAAAEEEDAPPAAPVVAVGPEAPVKPPRRKSAKKRAPAVAPAALAPARKRRAAHAEEDAAPPAGEVIRLDQDIEQINLLFQNDIDEDNAWECGYYAMFHAYAMKHNWTNRSPRNLRKKYNTFLGLLAAGNPEVAALHAAHTSLNSGQIEEFINNFKEADDVVVITDVSIGTHLPKDRETLAKIRRSRDRNALSWVILHIHRSHHWVCLQFKPDGDCVGADSYIGLDLLANQGIVQKVAALFWGHVPLPDAHNFARIDNALNNPHRRMIGDANAVKQLALASGFTEETFASFVADKVAPHPAEVVEIE
jgi:hypothetical protein